MQASYLWLFYWGLLAGNYEEDEDLEGDGRCLLKNDL